MSRKSQRNQPNPQRQDSPSASPGTRGSRGSEILTWSVVVVLLVAAV